MTFEAFIPISIEEAAPADGKAPRRRTALAPRVHGSKNVTLGVIRKGAETAIAVQPEMFERPIGPRNGRPRNPAPGPDGLEHRIPL